MEAPKPRTCHVISLSQLLILLLLQIGSRENREGKCTVAFSHASCSKSHHIDTMRKKGLWCTSLPALPAEQQKPFLRRKKIPKPNQTKKQNPPKTKKKKPQKTPPNPKLPNLPTKPTCDLYILKISQQDRTSPGMIHPTAWDPSTPGPSLQ